MVAVQAFGRAERLREEIGLGSYGPGPLEWREQNAAWQPRAARCKTMRRSIEREMKVDR